LVVIAVVAGEAVAQQQGGRAAAAARALLFNLVACAQGLVEVRKALEMDAAAFAPDW